MKLKKCFLKNALICFFIISIISIISCEVGLGSAVDTQPPSLTIDGPKMNAIIRESFAIKGSWNDDGSIEDVYVILKRTDGKLLDGVNEEKRIQGEWALSEDDRNKGSWRVVVEPLTEKEKLIDGIYQATVYIQDRSKHITTQTTSFTIDNTPPIIVITRPSTSIKAKSFDTYGQLFTLEGQAADDNNVSLIEVQVYNDEACTDFNHSISLKNVPNSINMDAAIYDKELGGYISQDEDKYNFEVPLEQSSGGKEFYCKIVAYDGAQKYPVDEKDKQDSDEKGNNADYYYLYKDIATVVLQNYKITEVYSILNGSYSSENSRSAITPEEVIDLIGSDELKTSVGKFILNPTNNPTFQITGRSPLLLNGEDFVDSKNDISNGGQIVVEVSPGLDGILLDEESLKVYAQKCDSNGKVAENAPKIYPSDPTIQESGTSYRFSIIIRRSDGFEIGGNYIVGVEGYDQSTTKNPVEPAGRAYGFHMASSGNAPSLEVTTPGSGEDVYKRTGQSQIFSGTVQVEAGVPVLNIYKTGVSDPIITKNFTLADAVNKNTKNEYSFSEEFGDFGTTSGKQVYRFVASLDGVTSPIVEREIIFDVISPEITISQPQLANKYDEDGNLDTSSKFVNGTIAFDISAKDKGGAGLGNASNPAQAIAKYEVIVDGQAVLSEEINLENEIAVAIDTTNSKINGKSFIFRVTAQDNAGNIGVSNDEDFTYFADQNTDVPYFVKHTLTPEEISDGKKDFDFNMKQISVYNSLDKTNKLGTVTKGDYLKFRCYDDDGTVRINIKNKRLLSNTQSDWENNINNLTSVYNKTKDTKALIEFDDYQFPNTDDDCGFYEYVIILSDGNKTETIGPFLVNVAKDKATIKVEVSPEYARNGNNFSNKITITPSMPPYSAYRKIEGNVDAEGNLIIENLPIGTETSPGVYEFSDLEVTDELNASQLLTNENPVIYYVVDGNNQASTEYKVILKKDNDAPETVSITAPPAGKINKLALNDDEYGFRGEVKDNKSGVKTLYYCFNQNETAPTDISAYNSEPASNGNYIINKTIDMGPTSSVAGNLYEGNWYLHIIAEDNAGNRTSPISRQFDIDKEAPELTETSADDMGYKNGTFTLSGKVFDSNGLKPGNEVVITDDKDNTYSPSIEFGANNTWTASIEGLSEGKHTLTITATDKAEKTTTLKRLVTIDSKKPVVSQDMILPNGYSFAGTSVTISGTTTDDTPSSGLECIKYLFADGETDSATKSQEFTLQNAAYWSENIDVSALSGSEMNGLFEQQGIKYIWVTAYDNAGNVSDTVKKSFVYDLNNPVISDVKIQYTGETEESALDTNTIYTKKTGYTISGNFSDSGSNVTIGVTSNGENCTVEQTANAKSGEWHFTTSDLADNSYTYIITATDASGRMNTVTAYIVVDTQNPEIVITETDDIYKNTNAHQFSGTITEPYLKSAKAYLYKNNIATLFKEEAISPVNGKWSWTVTGLEDAEYILKLEAEDDAGNHNEKASTKKLVIDSTKPVISLCADKKLFNVSGSPVNAGTALSASGTYFAKEGFTLTGTITEVNFKEATIKNGDSPLSFTSGGISAGEWTYTQAQTDGEYDYNIFVTDKAGNSESVHITVKIDTTAPQTNSITAPVEGSTGQSAISETSFIFKGLAFDAEDNTGTGVSKIWYAFTKDATAPGTAEEPLTAYTEMAVNDNAVWSIPKTINSGTSASASGNLYEGKWYLHVKAQDLAGNISEAASSRQFDIDFAKPELSLEVAKSVYNHQDITNGEGSFSVTGTASDSQALALVKVFAKKGTEAAKEISLTVTNGKVSNNDSWTQTFIFGSAASSADNYLSEGKYDIWAEAQDSVGKTTTTEKIQITIDYTEPQINENTLKLNDLAYDDNKWYDSKTLKVDIEVTDNTSGVSTVQCITKKNATEDRTVPLSKDNGDRYTGTAQLSSDGDSLTIKFKAKDIAGNETAEITKTVKIDTTVPALELYKYKVADGSLKSANGTVYINGTASLTVYGNYSDLQSGVKALSFAGTKNSVQPTVKYSTAAASDTNTSYTIDAITEENKATIKSWMAVFENANLETATLSVTGANNAGAEGLSVEKNLFAISRDELPPTLKNLNFTTDSDHFSVYAKKNDSGTVENYYINNTQGKFIISGLAEDPVDENNPAASGVESVKLEIEDTATPKHTYTKTSNTAYFANIDLSTFTTPATAKITLNDYAGNSYTYTLPQIIFDTAGPVSIHEIDSTGKDIVFRVGDKTNDDISSTNASAYSLAWNTYTDSSVSLSVTYEKIDESAGGKYAGGTFGNSTTLKIRGSFEDSGSGLKQVFYKIYDRSNSLIFDNGEERYNLTDAEKTQLVEDVISANQYFAPLTTPDYKRVFYNVNKSKYDSATVTDQKKLAFGGNQLKENGIAVTETKDGIEYYKFWKITETTYSFTIPQLNEGCNYLVVVAEDNVGNYYLDTSDPIDHDNNSSTDPRSFSNFSMNLDTTSPTIELQDPASTTIVYTSDSYTIKVKATDPGVLGVENSSSGIKSVSLTGNGQTVSCTKSPIEDDIWEANVEALLKENDSVTISATVKDVAGTSSDKVVANIFKDITKPSVSITAPADADKDTADIQVNGTISLKGTANDNSGGSGLKEESSGSKTLKLYYTTNSELGGKEAAEITAEDIKSQNAQTAADKFIFIQETDNSPSWQFENLVTSKIDGTTAIADNTPVYFMVSTQDKSGNVGYSKPQKVIVNQNTDRPVLVLSQISKNTVKTLKTKTVYGSVSDDDGTLEKLWFYSGAKAAMPVLPVFNTTNKTWTATGWTEITIDGNSWTVDSEENDGETTWYFALADANHSLFATVGDDEMKHPYLKYNDIENKVDGASTGVTFKYDTNPPTPTYLYLYKAEKNTTTALTTIAADTTIPWSTESNIAFGAAYDVLYAKIIVEEGTAMKSLKGANGALPTSTPVSISYKNSQGLSPLIYEKILEVAGTGTDAGKYTYYLGPLVMDTTEQHEFKITVEDAVGNKGYISRSIIVDNEGPTTLTNVKPSKLEAVSGVVNFRGSVNDNENGSGILYETDSNDVITAYGVEWFIPTYNQVAAGPTAISSGWEYPTTKGSASWEIEFTNLGTIIGYNSNTYEVNNDYKNFESGLNTGLYNIPVWFRLTDAVGNIGYVTNNSIRYNPNADRPTVQITYPVHEKDKDYVTMGGTINISGMANDDDGITAVYLQFDMDGDDIFENGVGIEGTPFTSTDIVDIPNTNSLQKGVLANGTKSWYKTLNISNIDSSATIKVRAISIEKDADKNTTDYLVSAWSDVLNIKVNNAVPTFSNIKLKKFDTAPTSATLATSSSSGEKEYASDMFIRGSETNWYLTGEIKVANNTTISSVSVRGAHSFDYTNDENAANDNLISYCEDQDIQCYFAIPVTLESNAGSKWEVTITAVDNTTGSPQSNRFQAVINLDRTAPNFTDTKTVAGNEEIKLYKNAYGSSGVEISSVSSENYVQNSNSSFTITGKINEEGSGFERLAFYFKRKGSGADTADRVYNPMEEHGPLNNANRTNIASKENESLYINSEDLPALYLTDIDRTNNLTIKSSALKNNKNIRKGGLVKIGDVYRLIDNVESRDSDGIITFTPGCDTSFTTAEFIYAMVIDNNGESTNSDGSLKNDDGDRMIESYTKSGTNYIWDANINSKNIPDGSIEIHCVVFDKAGNSCHGYTTSKVSNNPPRITSVMLGTNLNADTIYDLDTEFKTYYFSTNANGTGNTQAGTDIWNLDAKIDETNYWTAKNGLVVIPEFVGGTGTIYYKYTKSTGQNAVGLSTVETGTLTGTATIKELAVSDESIKQNGQDITLSGSDGNKIGAIILSNGSADTLTTISTTAGEINSEYTAPNIYRFSFWDSTEGCTPGQDSQWSVLNAKFKQDLQDDTPPTGTITPFYWESLTNNSIYSSKTAEEISSIADLEGHIELEGDLPEATFSSAATSGEYDRDPKVSGKIKIEGKAFDETRIAEIVVSFADKIITATYDSVNKSWSYEGNEEGIFKLSFTASSGPDQQGHSVDWELLADTSAVTSGKAAATDKTITVTVKDAASNSNTPGTDQTTEVAKTGYYKVDIVPYITGVKTALSKLKNSNPSIYARTALGHYPVSSTETITISGFNLTGGDVKFTGGATVAYNAAGNSLEALTSAKSGSMSILVNEVESLNNSNNDNGHGKYTKTVNLATDPTGDKTIFTNYYNRQPNGDNNNLLTDDVVVDIWDFNSEAVKPISGNIEQPVMKINPSTGQIGFAFVNGPAYFSMPGKIGETNYSYQYWSATLDFFTSIGLTYDKLGHSYGVAAGGDINSENNKNTADKFILGTDRIGTALVSGNIAYSSKQSTNALRMESVGMKGTKENPNENTYYFEKQRIKSPSLASAVHGDSTNLYLAYYDVMTDEIRFKYGNVSYTPETLISDTYVDDGNVAFNATEYMKWYYHAIYKNEDNVTKNRKMVLKADVSAKVKIAGTNYDKQSCSTGSTGASDSGKPNILILKNYDEAAMNDLVRQVIEAKLQEKGLGDTEEEAFATVMEKADQAYAAGTQANFWGLKTTGWDNNVPLKKALEDIKVTKLKLDIPSKSFDNFQDTETTSPPTQYNNTNVSMISGSDTGSMAGEYVSIGVVSSQGNTVDDVVVAVWYDAENRCLMYSYNTSPTTVRGGKTHAEGWYHEKDVTTGEGNAPIRIFTGDQENAGEYCQLAVDALGGIHIAAYDGSNSDLVYAYLSSYDASPVTCIVDSSGVVGSNITIDVALDSSGTKAIPRIGYFSNSCVKPKIAYLVDTDSINDGAVEETFTGKWESSIIPTPKTLNMQSAQYNKINVGVWKDTTGKITDSTPGTSETHQSGSSFDSDSYGFVYGNGTDNAVLGYSVKKGSNSTVETAQMR